MILAFAVSSTVAAAATYTWDGTVNNWNSPHWTPGPVGFPGAGHIMVVNNGVVSVTDSSPTYFPAGITLNGGTLKVVSSGHLFAGADATAQVITVNAGAVLELDTWFNADSQSLGRLAPTPARIVINGGTLRMTGVTGYGRGVTVNNSGATLEAAATSDWLLNQLTDDNAWVYNGNPTLSFTGAGVGRFEKAINSGTGGVIKRGQGKWTLSRTSTYSGATIVEQGILVLRRGSLNDTSLVSISSGAILSLRHYDGDVIGRLILGGVEMPPGTYNRSTHPAYIAGSGSLVLGGTNTTATPSLTWFYGSGGDAGIQQTLSNSMNFCVGQYNNYGYLHGNIRADFNAGVPTAQAGFNGPITFGGSRNGRTAMHEMGHVFGVGTHGNWGANLSGGIWTGPVASRLIRQIDGPGAVINSDGTHFWPYGLNYDNEDSPRNEICHVRMVEAFAQDMGTYQGISTISDITDRAIPTNGTTGPIAFTIGDPGVAAGSLVVHASSSNPPLVPAAGMVLGGAGANRTLTVTPTPGRSGVALIALVVSGGRDAALSSFALTVGNFRWSGGSGVWDNTSSNWNNGTEVWPAFGGNNDGLFNGPGGVVTIVGTINADDLVFASNGYEISGGALNLANTPALTVSNGVSAVIRSAVSGDVNGIAKEGGGALVLSGNTVGRQGIFVNAGTLVVNGDSSGSLLVEARNGTTLAGTGSLPNTSITGTAELSPGPGIGTLRSEDLTFGSNARLTMDLGTAINDRLIVAGNLTAAGVLKVNVTGSPVNGIHTLITYSGAVTGAFTLGAVPAGYSMALDHSAPGQVRLLVSGGSTRLVPVSLVDTGAVWKYFAQTNNLGTAWRSSSFNDAGWSSGPAMLGFGDANGLVPSTVIASNGQWTTYFRATFLIPNVSQVLALNARILRDDAAVVYLNGAEVWRDPNLPGTGVINYNTPATAALGGQDESAWTGIPLNPSSLRMGDNVVAIEVHQNSPTSSDIAMNFELPAILELPLNARLSFNHATLSWPAEAGWFSVQMTTNLNPPIAWSPALTPATESNGVWYLQLPDMTNAQTFFRLQGP